ncbi:DHA2 family efflux MFS transporter permease subunit [Scleromatobacter humisilvae]|uniref:DHA2 family efflux MFS transporter permease subunit n=1 Tax=Scleromatobacter humisilvae TaxID=2897159 RepID=A0A9X1YQM6_9BURK|nr:DHA2 family efflux MFS transporter permease subunit [Scleromatobacter humisilvae]MCK9686196.1 DHA2 family efflux MFS transporter permease subunit [Scleromatobacter humisilvae]
MESTRTQRYLPWIVATALFMEQLDSTIVNTGIPAMAASLGVTPLSLKAVVTSYILSLAVSIPISGWLAERYGSRRIFLIALGLFTVSSVLCGLAPNASLLVAARVPQGVAAAMMMPVGRSAVVRTFPKSELLRVMNFIIIPALIGPLLGPTVGGLIVHWLSWRDIFFVNVPVGLAALWLGRQFMPDYRTESPPPLDVVGLVLFGSGVALLSWLLEVFGEHTIPALQMTVLLLLSVVLLLAYGWHATQVPFPLLRLDVFKVRTFRISVLGGFVTRLGIGGLPFLLPLLYQLGLGLPAWESGLLMMPAAASAMFMKVMSSRLLRQFGYRQVLIVNTVLIAGGIATYSLIGPGASVWAIIPLGLVLGLFNSLQFSSLNTMAYADIEGADASMASTIASTLQQMSLSFGLAVASLVTVFFLADLPQSDHAAVTRALHHGYITMSVLTLVSSLAFWGLRKNDGESVSKGTPAQHEGEPRQSELS